MDPQIKVFLANEPRSYKPMLALAALLVCMGSGWFYFGDETSAPKKSAELRAEKQDPVTIVRAPQQAEKLTKPNVQSTTILLAAFNTDSDGFTYVDDAFRGTKNPDYASGIKIPDGFEGGGLIVRIGGVDGKKPEGLSGGWRRTFELTAPTALTISFRYNMTQSSEYEADEFTQVLMSLDGQHFGATGDYVAQIHGDGNGGKPPTTGWQIFQKTLAALPAGTHTLTLGLYNNKKTAENESAELKLDDVRVVTGAAAPLVAPTPVPLTQKPAVTPEKQDLTF